MLDPRNLSLTNRGLKVTTEESTSLIYFLNWPGIASNGSFNKILKGYFQLLSFNLISNELNFFLESKLFTSSNSTMKTNNLHIWIVLIGVLLAGLTEVYGQHGYFGAGSYGNSAGFGSRGFSRHLGGYSGVNFTNRFTQCAKVIV